MRQIYIKDLIERKPLIGVGEIELIRLGIQCPKCLVHLSVNRTTDKEVLEVGDCLCPQFIPSQGTIADRTKYKVILDDKDVSSELHLKNGKANPFGWSQYEVWHNDHRIGFLESGVLDINKEYIVRE